MNPDRFREAKRIYASVLEQEPAKRGPYLREACRGDEALQQEVESLLGCRTEAQEFFEASEAQAAARVLAPESHIDFTGRTLSHYAIVAKIDEGGMGVVYRARDTHLDRFVALKVLPPEKVADSERRRRFIQEAKAASALNHPSIITIHDIDTADGVTFIVMEYVNGRTLDQLIRNGPARVTDTLKQGVQIADALSAAHGAGIIHRDIKPANIMVTDSGLVKVLDFGLAKLTEPRGTADGAPVTAAAQTDDGLILGTVAYMSPEQAGGKEVDARSDIFSLGAVLYEMTTGRRAFAGESQASTLAAILRDVPKPVGQLAPEAPRELERIINRCLEKHRERRFEQMTDLKLALEELKGDSDPESTAAAPLPGLLGRRRLAWMWVPLLLAVALGLGIAWGVLGRRAAGPVPTVSALTALPGSQTEPAISPDGKQVAFVWNGDIHVQLVTEATPRQLTSNAAHEHSPIWSPDALYIVFLRAAPSRTDVIMVPSAGGTETRLLASSAWCDGLMARQYCGPAWSPDGRFLTVVDRDSPQAPNSIFLFDIETRQKRKLTNPPRGFEDGLSAFSPDGRTLAFARRPGWPLWDIYVLPFTQNGGQRADPLQVTRDNTFVWGMDWTADGRSIVFASSRGGVYALWRVAMSGGAPDRVAVSGNDAFWPSISRNAARLVYSYGNTNMHVWRTAAPGAEHTDTAATAPRRISNSPMWDQQPAFSPDGQQIAWSSTHSGSHQIWVSGSAGARPRQLTHLGIPGADSPRWSPDGRTIAFRGFTPGPRPELYVIAAEGGAPRRLTTNTSGVSVPNWSRDGAWVYFASNRGDGLAIWKVPAGGGSPVLVARPGWWPEESLDGKVIYYARVEEGIWKSAAGGGAPVLLAPNGMPPIFESPDGTFVYYKGRDTSIWKVPVAGGKAALVLNTGKRAIWTASERGIYVLDPDAVGGPAIELVPFAGARETVRLPGEASRYVEPAGTAAGLAASPDGRWLVYLHRERTDTNIMLVEHFH